MSFTPRAVFHTLDSLPRSYFLGHHRAGLAKMKTLLSSIDLVIECRDYRVPLTSRNPLFEETLADRERLVVYTKKDLGSGGRDEGAEREAVIRSWHAPHPVLFTSHLSRPSIRRVLAFASTHSSRTTSLTGSRMLVVGMPNVGKSTLLNALRALGVQKGKVAATGAQPGVTRKVATMVKVVPGDEGSEGVYLLDTPGVFVPYVPDAEAMLKLALCGSVKDTIIAPTSLADYLLFRINLVDSGLYGEYHGPTNEIGELLEAIAVKTGRLQKGGTGDTEAAALWMIQRWRNGHLGRFVLDEISPDGLEQARWVQQGMDPSMNQARKLGKEIRRQRTKQRISEAG